MLKGFIVLFTMGISVFLLKKKFKKIQKLGIAGVFFGLVLVGLSNIYSYNPRFAPRPLLGNSLVIIAQLFLAMMFVYEECILKDYEVQVWEIVGWEGIWGMLSSAAFISIFFLIPGNDFGSTENPIQATLQVMNDKQLFIGIATSSLVIGPFNYFGTALTKYASAMHRCLIDASRMCIVWIVSICCNWENFKIQQACGYVLIIIGNLVYYEIITLESILGKNFLKDKENMNMKLDNFEEEISDRLVAKKNAENNGNTENAGNIDTNNTNTSSCNIVNNSTIVTSKENSEVNKGNSKN